MSANLPGAWSGVVSKDRRWTAAEDALIGTAPDAVIAARVGRSVTAVQVRRSRIKIKMSGRAHRGAAAAGRLARHLAGESLSVIARSEGVSRAAVSLSVQGLLHGHRGPSGPRRAGRPATLPVDAEHF